MNYNYNACCWFPTSSSDKSGLKVTDCTVQSAEYWCFYGTSFWSWTDSRKFPGPTGGGVQVKHSKGLLAIDLDNQGAAV